MDHCIVLNCKNTIPSAKVTFHKLPKDPDLANKWFKVTRNSQLKNDSTKLENMKICSDHFDHRQYTNIEKRKLKWNAVPTIYNVQLDPAGISSVSSIERELVNPLKLSLRELRGVDFNLYNQLEITDDQRRENSSQKREIRTLLWDLKNSNCQIQLSQKNSKLIKELQCKQMAVYKFLLKCRRQYKSIQGISNICSSKKSRNLDQDMSHSAALLFAEQFSADEQEEIANLWTVEEKIRALMINMKTPKLYIILEKILALPPRSELRNLLNSFHISSGVNNVMFKSLANRVKQMKNPKDKICVLLMDEFPLKIGIQHQQGADKIVGFEDLGIHGQSKMPASYALVFMLRGLLKGWYQPVAYYFCYKEMPLIIQRRILAEVIESVNKIGLTISAIVCDPIARNTVVLQSYISIEAYGPFITASGNKVVKFYDPPSLLKHFRDCFMAHHIQYQSKSAKWYHLKILYEREREEELCLARKLTRNHLEPPERMIKRMDLVNEALSNTVAAAMYIYATSDAPEKIPMPWEAIATVNIIKIIDSLYDSFDRVPKRHRENKKMCSLVTETSNHAAVWAEALDSISEWKFYEPNSFKVIHTIAQDGWINNIESGLILRDNLLNENIKKFSVRRLNLDPMRKLFKGLRHNGKGTTCSQFLYDLKTYLLYESLIKSDSKNKLENAEDFLLIDMRSDCKMDEKSKRMENRGSDIPELDTLWAWEEPHLAYFETESVLWVSAFVSRLAVGKVTCMKCHECLVSDSGSLEHFVIDDKDSHLMNPSEKLCQLISKVTKFCNRVLPNMIHEKGMMVKLRDVCSERLDVLWLKSCEAHSVIMTNYILNVVLKIFVYQCCKKYTRGLRKTK